MKRNSKLKTKNSKLTEKEVEHVADLANLELSPQEIARFQEQLSKILDYVEILKEIRTENVEPTNQVTGQENVFREDEIGETLTQEEALSGTKDKYQGRFKIKAILEK